MLNPPILTSISTCAVIRHHLDLSHHWHSFLFQPRRRVPALDGNRWICVRRNDVSKLASWWKRCHGTLFCTLAMPSSTHVYNCCGSLSCIPVTSVDTIFFTNEVFRISVNDDIQHVLPSATMNFHNADNRQYSAWQVALTCVGTEQLVSLDVPRCDQ